MITGVIRYCDTDAVFLGVGGVLMSFSVVVLSADEKRQATSVVSQFCSACRWVGGGFSG